MSNRVIAEKYATALVELAEDNETLLKWEKELLLLLPSFEEKEVQNFFFSIEVDSALKIFEKIQEKANFSKVIYNFLKLLMKNKHFYFLSIIINSFLNFVDDEIGRAKFVVRIPNNLDESLKKKLEEKLASFTPTPPEVTYEIDESILGGFVAQTRNLLIDGSTKTHLNKLRKKIVQR